MNDKTCWRYMTCMYLVEFKKLLTRPFEQTPPAQKLKMALRAHAQKWLQTVRFHARTHFEFQGPRGLFKRSCLKKSQIESTTYLASLFAPSPTCQSRHCLLFASSLLAKRGNFPIKEFKASHNITYICKLQDIEFLLAGDPILEILETASCTLDVFQLVSDEKIFAKPIPKVKHDKD